MSKQSMPKALVQAALRQQASIGREYDSQGNHVTYWLQVSPDWRVYRHSVTGMMAALRQRAKG